MAFQTGSQVRPELADADLSGFARAGESIGAALADVGAKVGKGIEKYYKRKKEADETEGLLDFLEQINAFPGADRKALQAGINAVGAPTLVQLKSEIEDADRRSKLFPGELEVQGLAITGQELSNIATAQDTKFDRQLQPGREEAQKISIDAQNQAIAKSIADVNAQDTRLQMEQEKLNSVVKQQEIDTANAANQKRMLDAVTAGNMSNLEYIQAGGDMNALAKAEELTGGQSFATNQKMIQGIEEEFSYLTYDYKTNTWTDTRGRNRSGLPWQEFPELMNFLGTRESQALANEGFTLGRTIN